MSTSQEREQPETEIREDHKRSRLDEDNSQSVKHLPSLFEKLEQVVKKPKLYNLVVRNPLRPEKHEFTCDFCSNGTAIYASTEDYPEATLCMVCFPKVTRLACRSEPLCVSPPKEIKHNTADKQPVGPPKFHFGRSLQPPAQEPEAKPDKATQKPYKLGAHNSVPTPPPFNFGSGSQQTTPPVNEPAYRVVAF